MLLLLCVFSLRFEKVASSPEELLCSSSVFHDGRFPLDYPHDGRFPLDYPHASVWELCHLHTHTNLIILLSLMSSYVNVFATLLAVFLLLFCVADVWTDCMFHG